MLNILNPNNVTFLYVPFLPLYQGRNITLVTELEKSIYHNTQMPKKWPLSSFLWYTGWLFVNTYSAFGNLSSLWAHRKSDALGVVTGGTESVFDDGKQWNKALPFGRALAQPYTHYPFTPFFSICQ